MRESKWGGRRTLAAVGETAEPQSHLLREQCPVEGLSPAITVRIQGP